MKYLYPIFFFSFLIYYPLYGQIATKKMTFNDLRAKVRADGTFFLGTNGESGFTTKDYPEQSTINFAGVWIAGKDSNGQIRTAIQLPRTQGDFQTDFEPYNNKFNRIWEVTGEEIDQHLKDYRDNQIIDSPINSIFSYPGFLNPHSIVPYYNGFELPPNFHLFADFWDDDGDSIYDPIQGDYPSIASCPLSSFYPDYINASFYKTKNQRSFLHTVSIPMTFYAQFFGLHTPKNKILNETVFLSLRNAYTGSVPLDSFYLGLVIDFSIGCPEDDYIGVNSRNSVVYAYNSGNQDETCNAFLGFGKNPPVQAVTVLNGLLDENFQSTPKIKHIAILDDNQSEGWQPKSAEEVYNYLQGKNKLGIPFSDNGLPFTDHPNEPNGNSELALQHPAGKRRVLISIGPIELVPGAVQRPLFAFSFLQLKNASNLQNVDAVDRCLEEFQDYFYSHHLSPFCYGRLSNSTSGCSKVTTHISNLEKNPVFQVIPNPSTDEINISTTIPIQQLHIYNAVGQIIWQNDQQADNLKVNVNNWKSGIYFLKFCSGEQVWTKTFVRP